MNAAEVLAAALLAVSAVQDKVRIARTYAPTGGVAQARTGAVPLGDDCAAIPDGHGGYLLFAAEGLVEAFVADQPWFAGYSAVMVNLSDIAAMGGWPTALTNVIWARDPADTGALWDGMLAACAAYGVPMVGGHTCYRSAARHLAVSVLGQATKLLTSFDAQPGEDLVMAVDLAGAYFENYPFWNASTTQAPADLQRKMQLLPEIAAAGWSGVAKDLSMGGVPGTLHMLARTSGVGARLDVDAVPRPPGAPLEKWLTSFPSFGYLLTSRDENTARILQKFSENGVAAAVIGQINDTLEVTLSYQGHTALLAPVGTSEMIMN
ncbi:sll0787 family AIR synthase-like protein [Hymenobacter caeli]|uniref:Sll0787 family AIR synthase-like protein n=1 Tax=Hymenobacter caeli TaxID=2735894 RepID=A0ABX2FM22_9BACT|nr:sll0787 family AIR synthase-like protein [Hymenobacter caeli]NRT18190.1 hypothetical protein [Hymenobacter caeli]